MKEVIVDPLDESERDVKDIRSMDVTVQEIGEICCQKINEDMMESVECVMENHKASISIKDGYVHMSLPRDVSTHRHLLRDLQLI